MARSNHNKTEKKPEKIIPWQRYHLRLDVAVRKEKSPCRRADEVVDAVVVALIFNRAAGENDFTLPSRRRRRGGGNKSPKPKKLAWRDPNPKDSIYKKKNL